MVTMYNMLWECDFADEAGPSEKQSSSNTNIFYIAVGSACGLILLIALIVAIYYVRSSKSPSHGERLR